MFNLKNWYIKLLLAVIYFLPLIFILRVIYEGSIPFWFDPARDMKLALDNLKDPTLIGPPSGIPNIFYGPYWIWLISIGLLFSKDPRVVLFLVITLPYFTILPYVLYRFSKIIGIIPVVLFWLLFTTQVHYDDQLWNPNLSPLLYFSFVYLLTQVNTKAITKKNIILTGFTGFVGGLVMNFHIAFGISILVSTIIAYFIGFDTLAKKEHFKTHLKNRFILLVIFGAGILVAFTPFMLFEIRHGFNQTLSLLYTIKRAVIDDSAVVGQVGLNNMQILQSFFGSITRMFQMPQFFAVIFYAIFGSYLLCVKFEKPATLAKFTEKELRLLIILFAHALGILGIYLTSKNPVWDYHFIGVELLVLFTCLVIINKYKPLLTIFAIMTLYVVGLQSFHNIKTWRQTIDYPTYITKLNVTLSIYNDAKGQPFNVFIHEPAIYTHDYDYLFEWKGNEFNFVPERNNLVFKDKPSYLIIPKTTPENIKVDFINYRTPKKDFKTTGQWLGEDGTIILKREMK